MIYDYRKYIGDSKLRRIIDNAMKESLGKLRFAYSYKRLEEVYFDSQNMLEYLLDNVKKGDSIYIYDLSDLGNNDDEALENFDIICSKGVNIFECKKEKYESLAYSKEIQKEKPNFDNFKDTKIAEPIVETKEPGSNNPQQKTKSIDSIVKREAVIENQKTGGNSFDYKNSEGYKWVKTKVVQGANIEHILIGFNTLHEFNASKYSVDGKNPLSIEILKSWIDEIHESQSRGQQAPTGAELTPQEWRDRSIAFQWICNQIDEGTDDNVLIRKFNEYHNKNPKRFSSWTGDYLTQEELLNCKQNLEKLRKKIIEKRSEKVHQARAFEIITDKIKEALVNLKLNSEQNFYIDYPQTTIKITENHG